MTTNTLYLNTNSVDAQGNKCSFLTQTLESKSEPLWWHSQGLMYTASGYGKRIPTTMMVKFNNRWRRVYCCIYSNIGTLYIGKLEDNLIIQE